MLSSTLELTLRKALYLASSYKHQYATCEHLLIAIMEDKDVRLYWTDLSRQIFINFASLFICRL